MEKEREHALSKVGTLYSDNLKVYGTTSMSVGWRDEASQALRFEKLCKVFEITEPYKGDVTINDLGCGYGAMFPFLDRVRSVNLVRYHGYDISSDMLDSAKHFVSDPRAHFVQTSKAELNAEFSFVSGTFNVKFEASEEAWTDHIKQMLMDLNKVSSKGLAFNLLSTYVDWKEPHLYYGDPLMFFDFCKRNMSRYVTLLHDYPLYEWTILVRKQSS